MAQSPLGGSIPFTLPVTVYLMKLAALIDARGGNKKVSSALRQAWRAQSCSADLEQARVSTMRFIALHQVTAASDEMDPASLKRAGLK